MSEPSQYGQILSIASSGAIKALDDAAATRRNDSEGAALLAEIGQGYALLAQAAAQALTAEAVASSGNSF